MAKNLDKLRGMSVDELQKEELELREEVWKLRLQMTTGQLQDRHKVRDARRNLARVLTVMGEQERAAAGRNS